LPHWCLVCVGRRAATAGPWPSHSRWPSAASASAATKSGSKMVRGGRRPCGVDAAGPRAHGHSDCVDMRRRRVVTAAVAIANIVKSSLGPVGLDKMLVDDIGVRGQASFAERGVR